MAAEATETQRLLDLACQHAARGTGAPLTKVMRYRSDKGDLLVVAGKGWRPGIVGHARLGADMMSPPGQSYQTRESVLSGNIGEDPDLRYSSLLRDHGVVSVLNAPIAVDGVVWGVLEVDHTAPDAFGEDDQRFLLSLALTLALGIRHRQGQAALERNAEELGRRLAQADTYMREQNHRVRNYFQMILSILASRSRKASSEQLRADYREVMDRVAAVGLAHDLLTVESGQSVVDAATYLDALCSGLERSMGDELRIERDLEPLQLRPDRAVPLGLVLNELVTNCLKYAVNDRPDGFVSISFRVDAGTDEAVLVVRDNGPGMGEQRPGSLGLRLVRSLAAQLSGRVEIDSSSTGTAVTMTFPLVV
ncbi:histidine kinase dimerization/phosphoacceptor domain -containing protein [Roseicella sp. DB1501]|uniref:histidine kinase dimerization/phosphoacceptor domain -containing protein n=1 Tax=Roseicella sp. DB1501 TaxID=2730925 RepID=UPI001492001C|nr:GAF domain-containing protein [Roseicella sp. DB1501]